MQAFALIAFSRIDPDLRGHFENHYFEGQTFQEMAFESKYPAFWLEKICSLGRLEFSHELREVFFPALKELRLQECYCRLNSLPEDSDESILARYRELIEKYHRDINGG
jgi:hypothetical protein